MGEYVSQRLRTTQRTGLFVAAGCCQTLFVYDRDNEKRFQNCSWRRMLSWRVHPITSAAIGFNRNWKNKVSRCRYVLFGVLEVLAA